MRAISIAPALARDISQPSPGITDLCSFWQGEFKEAEGIITFPLFIALQ